MIIAFNFQHHQILLYDQWKRPHCSPFQKNELKCASSKDLMRKKKKIQHKSRNFLPSSFNILRSSNYYTTPRDYRLHPSKTNTEESTNTNSVVFVKSSITSDNSMKWSVFQRAFQPFSSKPKFSSFNVSSAKK